MTPIPYEVWLQATQNWVKYKHDPHACYFDDFGKFTGLSFDRYQYENGDRSTNNVMVPDAEKFYLLASPHFRTLLRAYEAKHGSVYNSEQHSDQSS